MTFRIGQKVKVAENNDNENYDDFRDKTLIITHIAKNSSQHPGYDEGVGQPLYDLKDAKTGKAIGSSLYEYELEAT